MLFNSIEFLFFFPTVTALYFLIPHRFRWLILLVASCVFYMAFVPRYLLVLGVLIGIDFVAGLWLDRPGLSPASRKGALLLSIGATCLVLFVFKYFNFFNANLESLARFLGWNYPIGVLTLILPIGLSFHTFQSLSYVIEVYRGNQKAERHLGIYSLYVLFYPQLVAGPIERPQNMLYQFREVHRFSAERTFDGLKLMAWGLFKKVVIADRLAIAVDQVYGNPQGYDGVPLILATVCFAVQIFCDFSGYSDMASGAAQVMGFRLMTNFKRPYHAASVAEFWTRWHISLSTWFRDYVYIPLGGNRKGRGRHYLSILVTFVLSGFWHGAGWTYIVWGMLNGAYLIVWSWSEGLRARLGRKLGADRHSVLFHCLGVATTFSLICFAWVFFRARDFSAAWYIATHLFTGWGRGFHPTDIGLDRYDLIVAACAIGIMEFVHILQRNGSVLKMVSMRPPWQRRLIYYTLVVGILFFGLFEKREFIYFQF